MSDKTITCHECGREFTFTAGEQEWFAQRNLSEPKYCRDCRQKRREQREMKNNKSSFDANRQENDQKAA